MPYKPYQNEETRSSILNGIADAENQAGWGRFFDTYAGFVFAIARNRGLPEADAHEIVQIVMQELCHGNAFASYDRTKGPFRPWLVHLVAWRIANYVRRTGEASRLQFTDPHGLEPLPEPGRTPLEREFETEWMETVTAAALDRLRAEVSETRFAIYHASAIEGLDTAAVQRLYGITADNLYQIRRRVGARFRVLLEEAMKSLDAPERPGAK